MSIPVHFGGKTGRASSPMRRRVWGFGAELAATVMENCLN
jgi:hypothetical protein